MTLRKAFISVSHYITRWEYIFWDTTCQLNVPPIIFSLKPHSFRISEMLEIRPISKGEESIEMLLSEKLELLPKGDLSYLKKSCWNVNITEQISYLLSVYMS